MRIGILTFQNADNYGAILQCLALCKYLENQGYQVEVLDYKQPYIERVYKPWRFDIVRNNILKIRFLAGYFMKVLPKTWKRHKAYQKFRKKHLHLSLPIYNKEDIPIKDAYIIGSDQVWSEHCTDGDDDIYWGCFDHHCGRVIGYAISSTLSSIQNKEKELILKRLKNFTKLSFRENGIKDYINEKFNYNAPIVLDPTLLPLGEYWKSLASEVSEKDSYILTYFLHKEKDSQSFKERIGKIASLYNMKLIDIFEVANSPDRFLAYIKGASLILTTSFHATVFSIIFRKQFFSINSYDGREHRYRDLLDSLQLQHRYIDNLDSLLDVMTPDKSRIDYNDVAIRLNELQINSIMYLEESLKA